MAGKGLLVQPDDIARPEVAALIERHAQLMRDTSPPESCHVMDVSELSAAGAQLFSVTDQDAVLGIGAYKFLAPSHAELKSMHVAAEARGRGVSKLLLSALIEAARDAGATRVSLETGVEDVFAAARALYEAFGFEVCGPFGTYSPDPLSVFMTRAV